MWLDVGVDDVEEQGVGDGGYAHAELSELAEVRPRTADLAKAVHELLCVFRRGVPLDEPPPKGFFETLPVGKELLVFAGLGHLNPPQECCSPEMLDHQADKVRVCETVEALGDGKDVEEVIDFVLVANTIVGRVLHAAECLLVELGGGDDAGSC